MNKHNLFLPPILFDLRMIKRFLAISLLCNAVLGAYVAKQLYYQFVTMPIEAGTGKKRDLFYHNWQIDLFRNRPMKSASIVFLGDSHTQMFGVSEFFGSNILNRGIGGDTTGGILLRLKEVTDRKPSKIFLQIGINDLLHGVPLSRSQANYRMIVERVLEESPSTLLYIQNLLPCSFGSLEEEAKRRHIQEMNLFLQQLATEHELPYIDLYSLFVKNNKLNSDYDCGDHLHLSAAGYNLWAKTIQGWVDE